MMPAMKRATLVFAMGLMWGCVGKADPAPDNSFEFGDGGTGGDGDGDGGTGGDGDGGTGGTGGTAVGGSGGNGGNGEEPCPDDVICIDTFPYIGDGDTSLAGASTYDSYSCAPDTDEGGPEIVYRVEIPEAGFLSVAV